MNKLLLSALTAFSVISAQAAVTEYSVTLNGPNEFPANASPGIGFGLVNYDDVAHTLELQVSFSGLQGTTTASHIHAPTTAPFFQNAGVATTTPSFTGFPLGVTTGSFSNTLDLTSASSYNPAFVTANGGTPAGAESALAAAMAGGLAYWNIHSSVAPGGEIRGFLVPVPEPSALALFGLGAGAIAWRLRRKI
jgi:hypothetical protein